MVRWQVGVCYRQPLGHHDAASRQRGEPACRPRAALGPASPEPPQNTPMTKTRPGQGPRQSHDPPAQPSQPASADPGRSPPPLPPPKFQGPRLAPRCQASCRAPMPNRASLASRGPPLRALVKPECSRTGCTHQRPPAPTARIGQWRRAQPSHPGCWNGSDTAVPRGGRSWGIGELLVWAGSGSSCVVLLSPELAAGL